MSTLILDKNKRIFVRQGAGIAGFSAMTYWNNKLVVGTRTFNPGPNLCYFNYGTNLEQAQFSGGAAQTVAMASEVWTRNYDADAPDIQKQLTSLTVRYVDHTDYAGGNFSIYYRVDQGTWVQIGGAAITIGTSKATKIKEFNILSAIGYHFQFKITSSYRFEILELVPYVRYMTKRQVRST